MCARRQLVKRARRASKVDNTTVGSTDGPFESKPARLCRLGGFLLQVIAGQSIAFATPVAVVEAVAIAAIAVSAIKAPIAAPFANRRPGSINMKTTPASFARRTPERRRRQLILQ